MTISNSDRLALERVFDLIRMKMEQKFFGSILVPMKFGKFGKIKVEEIIDVNTDHGVED